MLYIDSVLSEFKRRCSRTFKNDLKTSFTVVSLAKIGEV